MPLTYTESAALMQDMVFRGRVKVACLKFADSIVIENVPVSTHTSEVRWAFRCVQLLDTVVQETVPPTVMDAAVQTDGADITDDALQGAVEVTVRKLI